MYIVTDRIAVQHFIYLLSLEMALSIVHVVTATY